MTLDISQAPGETFDKSASLQESFEDGLWLGHVELRKHYLNGDVDILVEFVDRRTGMEWYAFLAAMPDGRDPAPILRKLYQFFPDGRIFECAISLSNNDLLDSPQCLTLPVFVGLKRKDEWPDIGRKSFYFSAATALFENILAPRSRENEAGLIDSAIKLDFPHQSAETLPKVASDLEGEMVAFVRDGSVWHDGDDLIELFSEVGIWLRTDEASLRFDGLGNVLIEVLDVFVGPLYE